MGLVKVDTFSDSLYTADELCERWGIHRKTLGRWMRTGFIPGTKEPFPSMRVGRKLRFSPDQVAQIEARMCRQKRKRIS